MRLSRCMYRAVLPALLAASAAAADVLVVDAGGGGDHLTIQAAVDAAADGDVLLVVPGSYPAFEVVGKGLAIVADGGLASVQAPGVRVLSTLPGQDVVLANLVAHGAKVGAVELPALTVVDAQGALRVEDCELRGGGGDSSNCSIACPGTEGEGGDAVHLERAADVCFARCTITGGKGVDLVINSQVDGGCGITALASQVSLHQCSVRGGDGGGDPVPTPDNLADGGDGGCGIAAADDAQTLMVVHLSGTAVRGGDGGDGGGCIDVGGDGGDGLVLTGTGGPGCRGLRLDSPLFGGAAGCGGLPTLPGQPLVLQGGALLTTFAGTARALSATSPVREDELATYTFEGLPGDLVLLVRGSGPGFRALPSLNGVLLLARQSVSTPLFAGTLPASGTLTVQLPAGKLPPAVEGAPGFVQALFRDPGGVGWLAGPATPVVVDPGF